MIGGPDSFGAGGWMNTPVETALPVDMQIKALKVQGIGTTADLSRDQMAKTVVGAPEITRFGS